MKWLFFSCAAYTHTYFFLHYLLQYFSMKKSPCSVPTKFLVWKISSLRLNIDAAATCALQNNICDRAFHFAVTLEIIHRAHRYMQPVADYGLLLIPTKPNNTLLLNKCRLKSGVYLVVFFFVLIFFFCLFFGKKNLMFYWN